jgi:hypothetical protein
MYFYSCISSGHMHSLLEPLKNAEALQSSQWLSSFPGCALKFPTCLAYHSGEQTQTASMLPTDGYCFDNAPEVGHFSAELNSE